MRWRDLDLLPPPLYPLDVRTLDNGDVSLRAIDPAYATPGPDEAQKF